MSTVFLIRAATMVLLLLLLGTAEVRIGPSVANKRECKQDIWTEAAIAVRYLLKMKLRRNSYLVAEPGYHRF